MSHFASALRCLSCMGPVPLHTLFVSWAKPSPCLCHGTCSAYGCDQCWDVAFASGSPPGGRQTSRNRSGLSRGWLLGFPINPSSSSAATRYCAAYPSPPASRGLPHRSHFCLPNPCPCWFYSPISLFPLLSPFTVFTHRFRTSPPSLCLSHLLWHVWVWSSAVRLAGVRRHPSEDCLSGGTIAGLP